MITEDEKDKAMQWLVDNAVNRAQAKSDRLMQEHMLKVVKAKCFEFSEGTVAERDAKAMIDRLYIEQLDRVKDAVELDEKLKNYAEAANAKLDVWRTESVNTRKVQ